MTVVNKSVLVHSCRPAAEELSRIELTLEGRYVEKRNPLTEKDLGAVPKSLKDAIPEPRALEGPPTYLRLPDKCRCRKWITLWAADEHHEIGKGMLVWHLKKGDLLRDESLIWMPVTRERVPRVDLISRPDIERAFIGSEKLSQHFWYNRSKRRYELRPRPSDITEKEWNQEARAEIEYEQKFRKRFMNVIEEWYQLYMTERAKLVVPWSNVEAKWKAATGSVEDPFRGRLLLAFGPDQRT